MKEENQNSTKRREVILAIARERVGIGEAIVTQIASQNQP